MMALEADSSNRYAAALVIALAVSVAIVVVALTHALAHMRVVA